MRTYLLPNRRHSIISDSKRILGKGVNKRSVLPIYTATRMQTEELERNIPRNKTQSEHALEPTAVGVIRFASTRFYIAKFCGILPAYGDQC